MTDNTGLVCANKEYNNFIEISERELLACLTDVFIGTIVWLNSPKIAKNECRQKLLADCYLAVNPDPNLEKRLLDEAKRLKKENNISENEFLLLSSSYLTRKLLSEKTLGDPERFTIKTALDILEDLKSEYQKDLLAEITDKNTELSKVSNERNHIKNSIEKLIHNKAIRSSRFVSYSLIGFYILGVLSPIPFAITLSLYWLSISALSSLIIFYISFYKKLGFKGLINYFYNRRYNKLKNKYL